MTWQLLGSTEVGEVPVVLPYFFSTGLVIVQCVSDYQKPKWIRAGYVAQHFEFAEITGPVVGSTKTFLFGASLLNFSPVALTPYQLEVRLVDWLPAAILSIWVESA